MSHAALDTVAQPTERRHAPRFPLAWAGTVFRVVLPILSILGLWYLAILFSGLPAFVIPRPERVLETLVTDHDLIATNLVSTLTVATLGLLIANVVGIGLAILFDTIPLTRQALMPAAITLRNVPYVALVTVLMLAIGDTPWSKAGVVALACFFPVLVNTMQGLRAADEVLLDRMRILNATWWETFRSVRLPFAVPHIIAAQQIAGTSAVIVAISAEWMISSEGLGYVINRAMQTYRGDQVYAVALIATTLSLAVYGLVHWIGRRLDWREPQGKERG
ncbi:ABC transporter permease [Roseomonas sp. CCTCC AB2023176]|uniref:ABC transporter permease n=1 Tax=Roseomonas sp. CCTCC AB2023176 TaxID=3342640 RepID=UPI0035D776AC